MEPPGAESHYTSQNRLRVGQHQPPLDPWRRSLRKALPSAQNLPARGRSGEAPRPLFDRRLADLTPAISRGESGTNDGCR
jgi:hypothetical protein